MSKHPILNDLNPQQKDAVLHTDGALLILAGAGSGKTKVITHRFAYLTNVLKVPATSIVAMTFTNKAAMEMRERIERLTGKNHNGLWIGTFHALSNRLLRKEIGRLGFGRDFVIYDEDDSHNLIRSILKELKMHEALYKGISSRITSLKASLISPQEFLESGNSFDFDEKFARVYVRYEDKLRENNALDFDDLIMHAVKLFEMHPDVLNEYQKKFSHIMIDEFQDTNIAQYRLSKLLAGGQKNICVVGDDDQSIYKFRGANVENMLAFEKDFPGCRIIRLEQNYRSTQTILNGASSVIARNPQRKPKKLWTEREEGEKIYCCITDDEIEEARYIARSIKEFYLKGRYSYGDFCVLYRTNFQSRVLEEALRVYGIPYRVIGGVSFYQRREIKDIVSYLKVINNPMDSVSLKRIINCPPRGIGDAAIARIENEARKKDKGLFETMRYIVNSGVHSRLKEKIRVFVKTMEELMECRRIALPRLLWLILEKTEYLKWVEEERVENLMEFISSSEGKDLQGLIDTASLFTGIDEPHGVNSVSLMTIHSVKGLEFPVVFIAGVEDGLLPHFHAIKNPEGLYEERRLFYVGITRAKDILILSGARKRKVYTSSQKQKPSRFLSEIPYKFCHYIEKVPVSATLSDAVSQDSRTKDFFPSSPFVTGVRVRHPKWGVGVVRDRYGESDDIKVMVNFPSVGIKRLSLKFANLEMLQ